MFATLFAALKTAMAEKAAEGVIGAAAGIAKDGLTAKTVAGLAREGLKNSQGASIESEQSPVFGELNMPDWNLINFNKKMKEGGL